MKLAGRMRLDPMLFTPLSSELGPSQADYAGKLATLMKERPKLELNACAQAGGDDYEALHRQLLAVQAQTTEAEAAQAIKPDWQTEHAQQLTELAQVRGKNLRRALVEEHGIPPSRIYLCKASANPKDALAGIKLEL